MASREIIDTLLDGLLDREADQGASVTYAGATYPCSGGDQFVMRLLQDGGFRQSTKTVIVVRLDVFPDGVTLPSHKQSLSYLSSPDDSPVNLRVDTTDTLFGDILILSCEDPSQSA